MSITSCKTPAWISLTYNVHVIWVIYSMSANVDLLKSWYFYFFGYKQKVQNTSVPHCRSFSQEESRFSSQEQWFVQFKPVKSSEIIGLKPVEDVSGNMALLGNRSLVEMETHFRCNDFHRLISKILWNVWKDGGCLVDNREYSAMSILNQNKDKVSLTYPNIPFPVIFCSISLWGCLDI